MVQCSVEFYFFLKSSFKKSEIVESSFQQSWLEK